MLRPLPIPPLLRESVEFRRFWNGQAISMLGDQVSLIALPLVAVLALDADAADMGYLATAALLPNLLFSLHAGAWVDRRGRRRQTMIAADLGRALLVATVPVAYAFDALTMAQLYAVAFATGTLSVLFFVSYSTLFTSIVPRARYVEANSLVHGSRALSFVAGPSIGGILVQLLSAPVTLLVDAFSFLGSAFFLGRIDAAEPPTEQAERGHIAAGARFILRTPELRAALASTAWINLFNFMFFALFVLFATDTLGVRPATLGLVLGAGAVGGVLGSVVTGRLAGRIGIGQTFVVGSILFPAPLVLVPLARGPQPVVLALLFLAEFGSGLGRDGARHLDRVDLPGARARPAAGAVLGRVHGRQLRRPADRRVRRRDRRQRDRGAAGAVDRVRRRDRRRALPAAVAAPADARAAGAGGMSPFERFAGWWDGGEVPVALATATPDGGPSARMVLLKGFDERGFAFFSGYESRKGRELATNPRAALLFHRPGEQVRVEGRVERLPPEESDAYWASRPEGSRRSAAASRQSEPIGSRAELEAAAASVGPDPPRPPSWGGYLLVPEVFEFWTHRDDRLHDRCEYRFTAGRWEMRLLQP